MKVLIDVSGSETELHSSPAAATLPQFDAGGPPDVDEEAIVRQSKRSAAVVIPELSVEAASPATKKSGGGVFGFFRRQKPKNGGDDRNRSAPESSAKNKSNSLGKKTAEKQQLDDREGKGKGSTLPADVKKEKDTGPGQLVSQSVDLYLGLQYFFHEAI